MGFNRANTTSHQNTLKGNISTIMDGRKTFPVKKMLSITFLNKSDFGDMHRKKLYIYIFLYYPNVCLKQYTNQKIIAN